MFVDCKQYSFSCFSETFRKMFSNLKVGDKVLINYEGICCVEIKGFWTGDSCTKTNNNPINQNSDLYFVYFGIIVDTEAMKNRSLNWYWIVGIEDQSEETILI